MYPVIGMTRLLGVKSGAIGDNGSRSTHPAKIHPALSDRTRQTVVRDIVDLTVELEQWSGPISQR
jgi:hypothetical protein